MGILRTDKISGLETPTPVTGSVVFDGTGDYLDATVEVLSANNFTFEMWINTSDTSTGYLTVFEYGQHNSSSNGIICQVRNTGGVTGIYTRNGTTDTSGAGISSPYPIKVSEWNHIAITRDGTTVRLHVNGIYTGSGTWSKDFTATDLRIASARYLSGEHFDGYISNFRMLNGTALYGSADFTVPAHELEVIGDTVLLCCNNSDSAGADGTGKTITVNGDAAGSTVSPGLTRDFTFGTEFKGVTTFDTQGYFVPPSGTTEQRNLSGTRGLFAGSNPQPADGGGNTIEFITVSTTGNSQDFGDRIGKGRRSIAAMSNHTRGVFGGSYGPSSTMGDTIDFVTIASTGNAVDFGDCLNDLTEATGISNNTRGIMAGGRTPTVHNVIQYITIPSLGNAVDFGDLLDATRNCASCQSPTRGLIGGGRTPTNLNVIQYVTIASTGNSIDFGDLTYGGGQGAMGGSNSIRGLFSGGFSPGASNAIEYVTIATTGNGQDFGDNTADTSNMNTMATSPTRACMFGADEPARTLSYVEIASTGNAQNFGSLYTDPTSNYSSGCSNGHGGLS